MKKTKKLFLSLLLCLTLVLASVSTASAATKPSLKVTYKGKTVALITYSSKKLVANMNGYSKAKLPTYKTIKSKLGKPTSTKKTADSVTYTYKKGKSKIVFAAWSGNLSAEVTVKDKNIAINGVKVGMKKATALKKLRSVFGKAAVSSTSSQIQVQQGGYMPLDITLKNGKVTKMYWFHS